jgi:hypothetical protein
VLYAAPPAWFADNVVQIGLVGVAVTTFLLLRFVQKTTTRVVALSLLAALALFVYVNRAPLRACAQTCECRIADRDIDVPFCETDLTMGRPLA